MTPNHICSSVGRTPNAQGVVSIFRYTVNSVLGPGNVLLHKYSFVQVYPSYPGGVQGLLGLSLQMVDRIQGIQQARPMHQPFKDRSVIPWAILKSASIAPLINGRKQIITMDWQTLYFRHIFCYCCYTNSAGVRRGYGSGIKPRISHSQSMFSSLEPHPQHFFSSPYLQI